jgi:hypothetical protein
MMQSTSPRILIAQKPENPGLTITMHSALRQSIEQGRLPAVIAALDNGADIEEADVHGYPGLPLRTACFLGQLDIVSELLNRGADIHAANGEGPGAPLRMASRRKHQDIVALLIEQGAQPAIDKPAIKLNPPTPIDQPVMEKVAPAPIEEAAPSADIVERRRQTSRRTFDFGPPQGLRERRNTEQRRATSVHELQLSENQWSSYFAPVTARAAHNDNHFDEASQVLSRVRD